MGTVNETILTRLTKGINNFFWGEKVEQAIPVELAIGDMNQNKDGALPTQGGRISLPDYTNLYALMEGEKFLIKNEIPIEILKILAHLSKYNGDVSNAVENVVSLGNTKDTITLDAGLSPKQSQKIIKDLRKKAKLWYSGGLPALKGDLLKQVAVFGCISAEIVPMANLKGVYKVVLVSPINIEFIYDAATQDYIPCQRVSNFTPTLNTQATIQNGGLIRLNPVTYKYFAVRRDDELPYAMPPFLSALESIKIEKDMLDNFKHVIHKLGVLGFLHAVVTAPKPEPNETPAAYQNRCKAYLKDYIVPELEKGLAKGVIAGFKDSHEFKVEGTNSNVAGARELFNLITEMKMSGLKQDPRLLGRQFSTTETYGKVILTKFTSQINSYQLAVDEFLSAMYKMELLLSGQGGIEVEVTSELPTVNDEKVDAEAYGMKVDNLIKLYDKGIITLDQFAQEAGYEKAAELAPRNTPQPPTATNTTQNDISTSDADYAALELSQGIGEFDYGHGIECSCTDHDKEILSLSVPNNKLEEFIAQYYAQTAANLSKASKRIAKLLANDLAALGNGVSQQQVTDRVLYTLYSNWGMLFGAAQTAIVNKWVKEIHTYLRKDLAIFKNWTKFDPKNPPKSVFGVLDYRVMSYYAKSDVLYLGKFITDEDTKKRVLQYIKDKYIGQNLPIGKGAEAYLSQFKKEFEDLLVGESWKVTRIISTTVNRMRNTAAAMYMADAGVERYEVQGIPDRLQCAWCSSLQGKKFSVVTSKANIEQLSQSDPSTIASVRPFIVSQLKADDVKDKSGEELQALGFDIPPFHPHCRDVIVAIL